MLPMMKYKRSIMKDKWQPINDEGWMMNDKCKMIEDNW